MFKSLLVLCVSFVSLTVSAQTYNGEKVELYLDQNSAGIMIDGRLYSICRYGASESFLSSKCSKDRPYLEFQSDVFGVFSRKTGALINDKGEVSLGKCYNDVIIKSAYCSGEAY